MVKWTAPNSCVVLKDNDSKLYINFEFVKENIIDIKNILTYKAKPSNL